MENTDKLVTLCAWSNTVKHDGEWITFDKYLERRFGLLATHGISPAAMVKLDAEIDEMDAPESNPVISPRRLAAVRATGLLDTPATNGFDRITRLGAALLNVPATFISLVDERRDFYLSHCGFGEPLASERQLEGETFCHFTIRSDDTLVIPDTLGDPRYANVPTVKSLGVAAYLGVPLVLPNGEIIGAFCAIDFAPREWTSSEVMAAQDLAGLALSEIELRQAAFDFQERLSASSNS